MARTLISKVYDTDGTKKGITMSSLGIELLKKYDTDRTKKGITMSLLGIEILIQK